MREARWQEALQLYHKALLEESELQAKATHAAYHLALRKAQVEQDAVDKAVAENPDTHPDKALGMNDDSRLRRLTLLLHEDEGFRQAFYLNEQVLSAQRENKATTECLSYGLDFLLAAANNPPNDTKFLDGFEVLEERLREEIDSLKSQLDIANTVCAEAGIDLGKHL